jgi:Spy/CpxP family protein refolding chaperone
MIFLASTSVAGAQAQSSGAASSPSSTDASATTSGAVMGYGPGWGPGGMMGGYEGGYGPGMMGYGHDPGMMGYGHVPGMMGYGHAPGMYGYGQGYGEGWHRGGGWSGGPLAAIDLTPEQQEKIAKIREDFRRNNWNAIGQLQSERFRLRQLYNAETLDSKALDDEQRKIDDIRRQMLKSRVEAHNQTMAVLTPDQRKKLRSYGP